MPWPVGSCARRSRRAPGGTGRMATLRPDAGWWIIYPRLAGEWSTTTGRVVCPVPGAEQPDQSIALVRNNWRVFGGDLIIIN